jgi:hypothetical protein
MNEQTIRRSPVLSRRAFARCAALAAAGAAIVPAKFHPHLPPPAIPRILTHKRWQERHYRRKIKLKWRRESRRFFANTEIACHQIKKTKFGGFPSNFKSQSIGCELIRWEIAISRQRC